WPPVNWRRTGHARSASDIASMVAIVAATRAPATATGPLALAAPDLVHDAVHRQAVAGFALAALAQHLHRPLDVRAPLLVGLGVLGHERLDVLWIEFRRMIAYVGGYLLVGHHRNLLADGQ